MLALCAGGLAACTAPPGVTGSESALRQAVVDAVRTELVRAERAPEPRTVARESYVDELRIDERVMPELEAMAGREAYDLDPTALPLADNLVGAPQRTVAISLERAIRSAVDENLEVQFARLAPAVAESQLVQAEAAFDWVFFSNLEFASTDRPSVGISTAGIENVNITDQNTLTSTTGFRRQLVTGGQLTLQQAVTYLDDQSPGRALGPDPSWALGLTAQLDQPLLRNYGTAVNKAQIQLTQNAERDAVAALKRELIRIVTNTESAYWELYRAHRDLLILQRLLERGITIRDQVIERERLDASRAEIADAVARVERRRADVLRAQTALRRASDNLKLLINDGSTPIGSELLLIPADTAIDEPIEFSLLDAATTAIRERPEITQAILSIDDTSIRQTVADNLRLPQLDLRLQLQADAIERDLDESYDEAFDGGFVSYLVGLFFEQPIGNRSAEALSRQRRLERMQAVVSYRNTIRQILLELKNALDAVSLNYRLIEQTRVSRIAATEVLRALQIEKEMLRGFTIDFLDLELNRQESLAAAEREELQALVDYNTAIADYYAALGTTLEHNGIDFVVPNPGDVIDDEGHIRSPSE